jgi:DNA-binding response OmpR family regulator
MGNETIFLLDDAAVSLKLTAALLRNEGYTVHVYSTAEQALLALRTLRPNLILADLRLPGMSGLEFIRQVRQDGRTKDMLVVPLSASDDPNDRREAQLAGCNGYLTKPIDTRTFAEQIRRLLNPRWEPQATTEEPAEVPASLVFSGPEMDDLRRNFLTDGARQCRALLASMSGYFDAANACETAHRWIGSAGVLGYQAIAAQARALETVLITPDRNEDRVRGAIAELAFAFTDPVEAAETPLPESLLEDLNRKRVALVGFADDEADRVCLAFERVRALPRIFDASEPVDSESIRSCSVAMVHVRPETANSPWLRADSPAPGPALMLVGGREQILAVDATVQARASEFLIDGWQAEEVVMRLGFALARAGNPKAEAGAVASPAAKARRPVGGRPEILIADDDMNVNAVVRLMIENHGMECLPTTNGRDALLIARERLPHAAVLDVNMPGLDGFEVLAAIRAEGLPIRVVLLTARQLEADVLRGFRLGADDYVVKPFNPLELVARLKRLLMT